MPSDFSSSRPAEHLSDRQTELRAISPGSLPAAAAPGGKLDAHADLRPHAHLLGVLQDEPELGVFLDDRDDVAPDLLGQHRHLDEFGVLEPVADDWRVVIGLGRDGEQLGFGPGLEAEPVFPAKIQHFFDDLALLIDFDRVDADVAALVLVLRDGTGKRVVNVGDAVLEDVAKPDEHGQPDASEHQVIGELLQVDRAGRILRRMDENVARRRDREVALAPAVQLVEIRRVGNGEGFARLPGALAARDRAAHANMIHTLFQNRCREMSVTEVTEMTEGAGQDQHARSTVLGAS